MGEGMDAFKKGFRKATGADDEEDKKKQDESQDSGDSNMQTARAMLSDAGGGLADMASSASEMLGFKKKKK